MIREDGGMDRGQGGTAVKRKLKWAVAARTRKEYKVDTLSFHLLLLGFTLKWLIFLGRGRPAGVEPRQQPTFYAAWVQQLSAPAPTWRAESAQALQAHLKWSSSSHKRALTRGCSNLVSDSSKLVLRADFLLELSALRWRVHLQVLHWEGTFVIMSALCSKTGRNLTYRWVNWGQRALQGFSLESWWKHDSSQKWPCKWTQTGASG